MLKEIWLEFPLKILNGSSGLRGSELKKGKILEYFYQPYIVFDIFKISQQGHALGPC